jgi:hypothetical protein
MTIDTQKKVIAIQLRRLLVMVFFILIFLIIIFFVNYKAVYLGLNRYQWGMVWTVFYLLSIIIESLFELKYIFFNDDTEKIVLRYFSLGYFNRKKQTIEIPKEEFAGYEIKNSFFGLKKKIILTRTFKSKDAKYPSVPLTILSKDQMDKMQASLDQYKK